MAYNGAQWQKWMIAAQNGDQRAYSRLLTQITPLLQNFVRKRLYNPQETDDVVQDILLAMHRVRATYNPAHPFAAWLFGIARHKLLDFYRCQQRPLHRATMSLDAEETALLETIGVTDTNISQTEAKWGIQHAFKGLTTLQQKLVWWQKIEGHSVRDVATELNMTETAVKVGTHRAMKKMQADAQQEDDSTPQPSKTGTNG